MSSGLPSVDELLDGSLGFAVPLRTRFRGTDVREGLLLRGPAGWGEFAPFPEYGPDESRTLAGRGDRGGVDRLARAGA